MNKPPPSALPDVRLLLGELAGQDLSNTDPSTPFLDLGFDSLFLTQAATAIKGKFGVKVTFRQLLESLTSMQLLADHLASSPGGLTLTGGRSSTLQNPAPIALTDTPRVSPATRPAPVGRATSTEDSTARETTSPGASIQESPTSTVLDRVIREQLRIMEHQLRLVRASAPPRFEVPVPVESPASASPLPSSEPSPNHTKAVERAPEQPQAVPAAADAAPRAQHGPFRQLDKGTKGGLTETQDTHLEKLIARYVARTPKSREYTDRHRARFADPRAVAGFKLNWKEMVYPIVTTRSSGSRLWDLDGNEWVDVTMGFGVALLGHSPAFITQAVKQQLDLGVEIGPQSPLAGEVAELICQMTGSERVTFCNTGSEAVMAALRICRTVTGRTKVVVFSGAYHGTFDEVLVKGVQVNGQPKTLAIAPGVAPNLISQVVVLDYGTRQSLEWIRENAATLAAVLVEPVQSRHPDLQPGDFLREIRTITAASETPLIFDEVITGFRCHPGGAQKWFGVEADLATYGKIVGGGMPFGFIAGKAWLMDAFDGGVWRFGDDSFPPTGVTFFAGTFVRHPLAMAAAKAMLLHLKEAGPELQAGLARRTSGMLGELNDYFQRHQVPLQIEHFTSVWYPHFGPEVKHGSLLYYHLREKGLHIWEGRPCFLSTAHTPADELFIQRAFKLSVAEMQAGGFLTGTSEPGLLPESQGTPPRSTVARPEETRQTAQPASPALVPLTEGQKEMWISAQIHPEASGASNACCVIELRGGVSEGILESAIQRLVDRHEALRATFHADGESLVIAPRQRARLVHHNLRDIPAHERGPRLQQFLDAEARELFNLAKGPLFRFHLVDTEPTIQWLVLSISMTVVDGWGINVLLEELGELYSAGVERRSPTLAPATPLRDYARWLTEPEQVRAADEARDYWSRQFAVLPEPLSLPCVGGRPSARTHQGSRASLQLDKAEYERVRNAARHGGGTPFAFLMAACQAWLRQLSGGNEIVLAVPFAGQSAMEAPRLVGQCVHTLPLRATVDPQASFSSLVRAARGSLLDAQENWNSGFGAVARQLNVQPDPSRLPLVNALFNLDPPMNRVGFSGLKHHIRSGPRAWFQYDIGFNLIEESEGLTVELDYNTGLFTPDQIARWLEDFRTLLAKAADDPSCPVELLPMPLASAAGETLWRHRDPAGRGSALSTHAPAPRRPRPAFEAPSTPTELQLARLWEDVLQETRIGVGDNFFDLGGQSIRAVALFKKMEHEFGRKLPLSTLFQHPTLGRLAAAIDGVERSPEAWSPLVPIQSLGSKPPLFLVHGAGGNVLLYQSLARRLAPDQPLYGLQSQGLDGKTPPLGSIEAMASLYLAEIRRVQPRGPYLIGGYCMGGTIAYEMARQLLNAGETVPGVLMLDTYNYTRTTVPSGWSAVQQRLKFHAGNLLRLPPGEWPGYFFEKLRVARDGEWRNLLGSGTRHATEGEKPVHGLREESVQAINDEACLAYRPVPIHTRLVLVQPQVNYDFYPDPLMGWERLALGGIDRATLPVNPHAMLVEPHVELLSREIRNRVDAWSRGQADPGGTRGLPQAA